MEQIKQSIREVADFPKEGINFYDITTLLSDNNAYQKTLDMMTDIITQKNPNKLAVIEARGFIFGSAIADRLSLPLIPIRKPGKLPYRTIDETYELEYGHNSLQIHEDAVEQGDSVVIVDDLIATGGTMAAACKLIKRLGGDIAGIIAVIALLDLNFAEKLKDYPEIDYLISYP